VSYLRQTRRGALNIHRAAVHEEEKLDGKWGATSNDDTRSAEDLALGYKQLMRVEVTIACKVGEFSRFDKATQLMAYAGVVEARTLER
jgi:hypothetical protein